MFHNASPAIFEKARLLRNKMTFAEKKLWEYLRNKKLNGLRFKAQHPIMGFIADFYCHKMKLVIELDGISHLGENQLEYDNGRTYELEKFGIKVIRFKNEQINNDINTVLNEIKRMCVLEFPFRGQG